MKGYANYKDTDQPGHQGVWSDPLLPMHVILMCLNIGKPKNH